MRHEPMRIVGRRVEADDVIEVTANEVYRCLDSRTGQDRVGYS